MRSRANAAPDLARRPRLHLRSWVAAAALVLVAPPTADAVTAKTRETVTRTAVFTGAGCGATDSFTVRAPRGGFAIAAVTPRRDAVVGDGIRRLATVTGISVGRTDGRSSVRWTVTGTDGACEASDALDCDLVADAACSGLDAGWETRAVPLTARYLVRRAVRLTLGQLRSDAVATIDLALDGAWDNGYGKRLSCRKTAELVGACTFSFFVGDGVYQGSFVTTRVVQRRRGSRPDRVFIRNRGSATLVDEYCQVTGGRGCVTRIPIRFG